MYRRPITAAERIAARFVPNGSTPTTAEGITAVVYSWDVAGRFHAIAYRGTSSKAVWHYAYKTQAMRLHAIARFFDQQAGVAKYSADLKATAAAKKAAGHGAEVGAIFSTSWGYDQTNVDFYQVVAVTRATITTRKLCQSRTDTSYMSGTTLPVPDHFASDETFRSIYNGSGFKIEDHYASPWTGEPRHFSSYA